MNARIAPVVVDKETQRQVAALTKAGVAPHSIQTFIRNRTNSLPDPRGAKIVLPPAKRGFVGFLRHPFKKPEVMELRHRACIHGPCQICPAGAMKNGVCGGTAPRGNFCSSGSFWNGRHCTVLGIGYRNYNCYTAPDSDLLNAKRNMQAAERDQQAACSANAASQECADTNVVYQRLVGEYKLRARLHQRTFDECLVGSPFGYFDPIQFP